MAEIINLKHEYASEAECKKALAAYNEGKDKAEQMYYCSYWNSEKRRRFYVPCDWDFYIQWRNMLAKEHKARDEETRCRIKSERYATQTKVCREDCANCPYGKDHREGKALSLEQAQEDGYLESSMLDQPDDDPLANVIRMENRQWLAKQLAALDETNRRILVLFAQGKSDAEIGRSLGLPKSTVQHRRATLLETLRKKYQKNS